ncbi:nucleotidyltransferase domain-containing protein [Candidatus Woesearchaeota archaeon]|nr:nucleotidyltransferase domain-containing protein [Candidatus Woesearchaeota archaeon]
MGGKKTEIDKNTRDFIMKIRKQFNPDKIILFGSRAEGNAWVYSDYDFIIVSDKFEKVHGLTGFLK